MEKLSAVGSGVDARGSLKKRPFMVAVLLIAMSVLVFQIIQTRILSVMAWYHLAFLAISVAMLGMTVGAVWVYLRRDHFVAERLAQLTSDFSLAAAVAMPLSLILQFSLVTTLSASLVTLISWSLLLTVMAIPYVFAGVAISLALTRSPFPVSQVYGVDLIGAALGCVLVILMLNVLDAPSAVILAGAIAAAAAWLFAGSGDDAKAEISARSSWLQPKRIFVILLVFTAVNASVDVGVRPVLVKDRLERAGGNYYERWNSYSRVIGSRPQPGLPDMWGPSPHMPTDVDVSWVSLNIDGEAATVMMGYDGTPSSIEILSYDIVNLPYILPNLGKAAVIGVGGGRDVMAAHYFGVPEIIGIELNPIFIDALQNHHRYRDFANMAGIPNLRLEVDDARSWFASTDERFDIVQMSMIDTWAATGVGAFTLSENGLYTLEGWRAFIDRLNDGGVFTVSRWYNPDNIDEAGRMISLATAALLDLGTEDPRQHLFVAHGGQIATLVLSKTPLSTQQLDILRGRTLELGFDVLLAPDQQPQSSLLRDIIASPNIAEINRVAAAAPIDISVPTDNRPFFFNQLRLSDVPAFVMNLRAEQLGGGLQGGVIFGNLIATATLVLILFISLIAVVATIIVPLRNTARDANPRLIRAGTAYFALIGLGFMLAEIAALQYFSVFLGHPIYSLGVVLFCLILATGLGSLASEKLSITRPAALLVWAALTGAYLLLLQGNLGQIFQAATAESLGVRIALSLALLMPLGFLLGFAFPSGMRMVEAVDAEPTPWFWGINGATGVLASGLAVMTSMTFGINFTMTLAAICYLLLIPVGTVLLRLPDAAVAADVSSDSAAQPGFGER